MYMGIGIILFLVFLYFAFDIFVWMLGMMVGFNIFTDNGWRLSHVIAGWLVAITGSRMAMSVANALELGDGIILATLCLICWCIATVFYGIICWILGI